MDDKFENNIPVRNGKKLIFNFVLFKEIIIIKNSRHKGEQSTEHVVVLFCFSGEELAAFHGKVDRVNSSYQPYVTNVHSVDLCGEP